MASFADVGQDEGLWQDIEGILKPVIVREMVRYFRLGIMIGIVEMDAIEKDFSEDVQARADAMLADLVQEEFNALGDPTFPLEDWPALNEYVETIFYSQWWRGWSSRERQNVSRIVNQANRENWSLRQTTEALTPAFGRARASLIASTEMTNIMGIANQTAYRRHGFTEWEWRTAADRRVDPVCESLDGEIFPMTVTFSSAHPRCRCWPVPVAGSLGQAPRERRVVTPSGDVYPEDWAIEYRRKGTPFPEGGFSTWKEADAWFGERYPWIKGYFSNAYMPVMNPTLRNFDLLAGQFPAIAARLRSFGMKAAGTRFGREYAHATFDGRFLGLNSSFFSTRGKNHKRTIESVRSCTELDEWSRGLEWHPKGTADVGSVVVHEFGHLVDGWLSDWGGALPGVGRETWLSDVHRNRVKQSSAVSRYGQKHRDEAYAEAFAQWFIAKHDLPGAVSLDAIHPHSQAVGQFFEVINPQTMRSGMLPLSEGLPDEIKRLNNDLLGPIVEQIADDRKKASERR